MTVAGLGGAASQVSVGSGYTCAIVNGKVKCWGLNDEGQLGDGTKVNRTSPREVLFVSGATQVATSGFSTCVLLASKMVKCWGYNGAGQLGIGNRTSSMIPRTVPGLTNIKAITAVNESVCALAVNGSLKCWGANYHGHLGTGDTTDRLRPTSVQSLGGTVRSVSMMTGSTCAVLTSGAAQCWGRNDYGQLGDGTTVWSTLPVSVLGLPGPVKDIAPGFNHTCALLESNAAYCWGKNDAAQMGNGLQDYSVPQMTPGLVLGF